MMPRGGAYLVADLQPHRMVTIAFDRCDRRGRYRPSSIVEMWSADTALPDVLATLAADCPARGS
jgi:hypothetical protein